LPESKSFSNKPRSASQHNLLKKRDFDEFQDTEVKAESFGEEFEDLNENEEDL
jgi:hypothetical protein